MSFLSCFFISLSMSVYYLHRLFRKATPTFFSFQQKIIHTLALLRSSKR